MIKAKLVLKKIIMFFLVFIGLVLLQNKAFAIPLDNTKKASLTIVECENAYGGENKQSVDGKCPLKDVEVTIYLIEKGTRHTNNETASFIETKINSNTFIPEFTKTLKTGENGTVKFENLEFGRYLVVATDIPKNVTVKMESFLVDLPRTAENGTEYNYDLTVFPKNTTVYGSLKIIKKDEVTLKPIKGAIFELQKENAQGKYIKYNYSDYLSTNSNGEININGLEVGNYRIIETVPANGYILDKRLFYDFSISSDNTSVILNITNEKPMVTKQVKTGENSYGKYGSAFQTENSTWKIEANIPKTILNLKTYTLTDTLPIGIDLVSGSVEIKCIDGEREKNLIENEGYTLNQNGRQIEISLTPEMLATYSKLLVTYETYFNSNVRYGMAEENTVTLTYTNIIKENGLPDEDSTFTTLVDENSKAEVHIGKVVFFKVNKNGDYLSGAKFKISSSKEDALKDIYIKDSNNNDIIAISDKNGNVVFTGLKYGVNVPAHLGNQKYWLTEIESPTYIENGQTKHYNLLSSPEEVIVDSNSGIISNNTLKIVNQKGLVIPYAGGKSVILMFLGISIILVAIFLKKRNGG